MLNHWHISCKDYKKKHKTCSSIQETTCITCLKFYISIPEGPGDDYSLVNNIAKKRILELAYVKEFDKLINEEN